MDGYGVDDLVEIKVPDHRYVVGRIVGGPLVDVDEVAWFRVEAISSGPEDGRVYEVKADQITVVLDSESGEDE